MNILDLAASDFENALKELRLQPEQEQFLRDEWAKKNTISGQMTSAFQEATQLPEGRVRANILPMTKPEGMSGIEAIRSGEAELALPGMLTGAVESTGQAATTAEKMTSGIGVTEEEMQQAASVASGLGMTGAVTRLGKPLDMNVVSSGGAGPGKTYKPSMFSQGEVSVKPSAYSVTEFYSPVVETIKNTDFPSKGYKGSELLKLLQDKTPGVRKAELDAMDLGIDPQKRYSKEEIQSLAEKKSYKVYAEIVDNDIYADDQRQLVGDQEVDTTTIKVNAKPVSEDVPSFLPLHGYTHYDPETIAHTRMSLRQNSEGQEYMLVEEIQSDLLQKGTLKPRGAISTDEAYNEVIDLTVEGLPEEGLFSGSKATYRTNKDFFDTVFKSNAERYRQYNKGENGKAVTPEEKKYLSDLSDKEEKLLEEYKDNGTFYNQDFQRIYNIFKNTGMDEAFRVDKRTLPVGKAPITEDSDAVRLTLQAAMAKAADSDVTSLVIPNIERIVSARARPGSQEYKNFLKSGSGFQRTYNKGVEKFLKQLKDQYGDLVKIDTVELPYTKTHYYYQGEEQNLPSTAIRIDFGGLEGVDFRVSRFAEGGVVEDTQMRRLLQEGGMTDDGMEVEPVTGNEVPPGSLASEVRDDIPAQLSEGEYVVPADVVRFFGVKFFEDLRAQAKQGLSEMDSQGRIGGAKVDASGVPVEDDDELTPEEERMLMEALGASGQGQTMGMAEGGAVGGFDRTQFQLGGSSTIQSIKYINPTTKEVRYFQFAGTVPLGLIPEGFVPWTAELEQQTNEEPETAPTREDTGTRTNRPANTVEVKKSGEAGTGYESWAEKNYESIMNDPYQFGINALNDTSGQLLAKGASALGLATGATPVALIGTAIKMGNKIQNIAEANAALKVMESQGLAGTTQYKSLEAEIRKASSDVPVTQLGLVGTGQNMYEAVVKKQSSGLTETTEPAKSSGTTAGTPAPAPAAKTGTSSKSSSNQATTAARIDAAIAATKARAEAAAKLPNNFVATPSNNTIGGGTKYAGAYTSNLGNTVDKTATEDRRAVGGLMSKKKYKAPNKGLAGK